MHIWYDLAVWGYLDDSIVVDVQNAHMICTKCYVASSYNTNDDKGGWVRTIGVLEDCTERIIVQLNDYWIAICSYMIFTTTYA